MPGIEELCSLILALFWWLQRRCRFSSCGVRQKSLLTPGEVGRLQISLLGGNLWGRLGQALGHRILGSRPTQVVQGSALSYSLPQPESLFTACKFIDLEYNAIIATKADFIKCLSRSFKKSLHLKR